MKRVYVFVPLISALFLTFASCRQDFISSDGSAWGTTYHIVYSSDASLDDSISAVIERVNSGLSVFNPASQVRAVNENRLDSVDSDFAAVFALAQRVSQAAGGRYDPTVAPLVDLWGFGPSGDRVVPDSAAVATALDAVGIGECALLPDGHLIKKSAATAFDFSSVAKGYGVDLMADMLERNGVENYMVEIGGEIAARGRNPRGQAWHIQVDAPCTDELHRRLEVVELGPDRMALASSGNYRNYRADSAGNVYGHTLSPLTGYPLQTQVLAATVGAASCALADAVATACMCSDPDEALQLAEALGCKVLLVTAEPDSMAVRRSPAFP